jgi:poly(3-hydroxyalkanoate) synthetase
VLNPAAVKAAIDTCGGSALAGLRHFVSDMAAPPRVPSMVEPDAFEVGVDLAVTPGKVVLRTPVFELIQYRPATAAVRQVPLLIVPPTINKFYIIDLTPGRSMAEYLVGSGQEWLRHADNCRGSWWPDYAAWLAERCGEEKAAPDELGGGGLAPICDAPGTYVYDH